MAESQSNRPKRGAEPSSKKGRGKTTTLGKVVRWLLIVILAGALAVTVAGFIFYERAELPDVNAEFDTQTTRLYVRDGQTELGQLAGPNRTVVGFEQMPQSIQD